MNVPEWIDTIKHNWRQPVDDWKSMQIDFTVPVMDSDQRVRIVYRMSMSEWQQGWGWFTADANRVHPYWWYPRVHAHIIDTLDTLGLDFDRDTGYAIIRPVINLPMIGQYEKRDTTAEKTIRIITHDRYGNTESIVQAVIDADQRTLVFQAPDGSQFIGVYHFVQYRVDYETYHINVLLMYPLTDDYQKMLDDAIAQNLELMKRTTYVRTLWAG